MAAFKEPKKFGVIPGNAADVTAIQDAGSVLNPSMADIFPAIYQVPLGQGGKAPERTTFNAFLTLYGEALYFLQRGGVWSYDATADYPAGAVVGYSGSLYLALGDNGPGTGTGAVTPGKNTAVWQKLVLESGNAASATKLATARTINGTAFNGTANITTANWGTARNIAIADATATNTSEAVSVNGSAAVTLKLPAAIKANVTGSLTGNAATATKLATARTIALSGAATGTATGFDGSGNITIPVTALSPSAIRAQWYAAYPDGAAAHNAMWGGRDITAAFNNGTVSANIANGTFKDIFPGDYITKQVTIPKVLADAGTTEIFAGGTLTVNWVIADCDYWINKGDTAMTAHHVAIVPQQPIFNARMNSTNTTEGGYKGSEMYRNIIPACATGIVSAFGSEHILTFRDLIVNNINASGISLGNSSWLGVSALGSGQWVDAQCNLIGEHMVYGHSVWSSGGENQMIQTRQMSAFRLSEKLINYNRQWWWLRDVVWSAGFALVYGAGGAYARGASDARGVRPFALLR